MARDHDPGKPSAIKNRGPSQATTPATVATTTREGNRSDAVGDMHAYRNNNKQRGGPFKRDRQDNQRPLQKREGGPKQIDLQALRKDKSGNQSDNKGNMNLKKRNLKNRRRDRRDKNKRPEDKDPAAKKERLDRELENYWVKAGNKDLGKQTHDPTLCLMV